MSEDLERRVRCLEAEAALSRERCEYLSHSVTRLTGLLDRVADAVTKLVDRMALK